MKSAGRNPGAAKEPFFTSTANTVAAIWLRAKQAPYHWRTQNGRECRLLSRCGTGRHAALVCSHFSPRSARPPRSSAFARSPASAPSRSRRWRAPPPRAWLPHPNCSTSRSSSEGTTWRSRCSPLRESASPLSIASPRKRRSRYLCLELRRAGRGGARRLCLGGRPKTHQRVGLELLNASGQTVGKDDLPRP